MWNDSAIQAANPALATLLPAEPILIGYNDNTNDMTIIEVLKLSLESFSPAFKAALAAANRTLANLPPAKSGTMVLAGNSTASRISWLKVTTNLCVLRVRGEAFMHLRSSVRCSSVFC
jgi:hypothetical protein